MKIARLLPFLSFCLIAALTSCESDVKDIELKDASSKLVVVSFISPQDTLVKVQLQNSQPSIGKRLGPEQLKVKGATVTISSGSAVLALGYNEETDIYEANVKGKPLKAGVLYTLKVLTPGGAAAEASCSIPSQEEIAITEVNVIRKEENDSYNTLTKNTISYKWRDAPGVQNFYRTLAYREFTISHDGSNKQSYRNAILVDYGKSDLLNDEKAQNGILTSETMVHYSHSSNIEEKPSYLYSVLVVADRHYYLYHQSLQKQQQFDGNPFAEPILMYSNVKGGIGVFAGYNQVVAVKEIH